MPLTRIIKVTLITICLVFLGFEFLKLEFEAAVARVALLALLTLFYFVTIKSKNLFFILFLSCFGLAELIGLSSFYFEITETSSDFFYYSINGLYIASYLFLIIRVVREMDFSSIIKRFWIYLVVLIILDISCVYILMETTEKQIPSFKIYMEMLYNAIIMALLTIAMIDYMSRTTLKSMNFLLGAVLIFFSEIIQITYFYVLDDPILKILYSSFLILAFLFLYLQANIPLEECEETCPQDSIA